MTSRATTQTMYQRRSAWALSPSCAGESVSVNSTSTQWSRVAISNSVSMALGVESKVRSALYQTRSAIPPCRSASHRQSLTLSHR